MRRLALARSDRRALPCLKPVGRVSPSAAHSAGLLNGRIAVLIACLILSWSTGAGGEQPVDELTAKIQFMHYVAQYAIWPKDALPPTDKQFVLGVLGNNP